MIPNVLLLSASLYATPVFISEVRATREAGHLRVEVSADGGIDPEVARTRIEEGRLILVLGGTHVRADNRAWELEEGVGEIRAHRHRNETELEVPMIGNGCSGPVELQGTATGLTALVGCDGGGASLPARGGAERRPAQATRGTEAAATTEAAKLEKLIALPVGGPAEPFPASVKVAGGSALAKATEKMSGKIVEKTAGEKATAEKVMPKATERTPERAEPAVLPAKTAVAPAVKTVESGPSTAASAGPPRAASAAPGPGTILTAVTPKPVAAYLAPTGAPAGAARLEAATAQGATSVPLPARAATDDAESLEKATTSAPTRLRAVTLPALLLAGLAVAAYLFARRRRVPKLRQIEILETASLGPKRSLVVARVGEETLVLGTSEAGITLLKTTGGSGASDPAPAGTLTSALALSNMLAPALASPARPSQPMAPATASPPAAAARPSSSASPVTSSSLPASETGPRSLEMAPPSASPVPASLSDSLASGPVSAAAAAHAAEMAQPLVEALADVPEPDRTPVRTRTAEPDRAPEPVVSRAMFRSIEGGLASLFGRNTSDAEPVSRASSPRFDDILEDSFEDQELRRKLAAGMSTRVR
jgi:flagellar protein FliO/FliZ